MKRILFLFFYFLIGLFVNAQTPFERYYTFSTWTTGLQVLELPGEGYITIGVVDSLAFDSLSQPYMDFIQGIVIKFDYNGNIIKSVPVGNGDTTFMQLYGANSDDFFRTGFITSDTCIYIAGETQSYNADNLYDYDLWLLKFNKNLDLITMNNFSLPDTSFSMVYAIGKKIHNDGIVLAGFQDYLGQIVNSQFMISTFDSSCQLIFHQRMLTQYKGLFLGVCEVENHQFAGVGYIINNVANNDLSPIVVKTDSLGNVLWYRILPYSGDIDLALDILYTNDGNYVFNWSTVELAPGATHKVWIDHLTKIDTAGNELWSKSYGYSFDQGQRIKELSNGNLMMVGRSTDTISFDSKALLRICDHDGNFIREKTFTGPGSALLVCNDGIATSDGGFILTGETYCCNFTPNIGWTSSVWLFKTDSLGLFTSVINLPKPLLSLASMSIPFPNPCKDYCTITTIIPPESESLIGEKGSFLLLFDLLGKQLQKIEVTIGLNQTMIDLSKYAAGQYVIALSVEGFNAGTKKIIKE